ncbi:MAG: HAD family hydrolase [Gemmatimonadales bacterium]
MTTRLVLFDIDGTLLLSAGAGRRAIMAAMEDLLPAGQDYQQVRFDGKTDPQIVAELLAAAGDAEPDNPATIGRVLDRYVALLERELSAGERRAELLRGVADLLDALERESSVMLGLLTGNVVPGAHLKLRAAGLDPGRFRVGAYGSDSHHRPDLPPIATRRAADLLGHEPEGDRVVIIGDTPADVTCGAGIGARAIAVATGAYPIEELEAYLPWRAFPDLGNTDAVVEAILA